MATAMGNSLWKPKKKVLFFLTRRIFTSATYSNTMTLTTTSAPRREQPCGNVNTIFPAVSKNVTAVCKQSQLKEELDNLYILDQRGIQVDSDTYASVLQACLNVNTLLEGKLVHAHMIETGFNPDSFLETKLVVLYTKCGSLVDARRVLDDMPERNVVSWTAMIAAYARHGCDEEALTLFNHMQRTGIQPNQFTFSSVLPACAALAVLEHGKMVHEGIIRCGFQSNVFVASALVDTYVKCGSIKDARNVFDRMSERNVVSWTTMIAGYAQNGHVDEALELFMSNKIGQEAMVANL